MHLPADNADDAAEQPPEEPAFERPLDPAPSARGKSLAGVEAEAHKRAVEERRRIKDPSEWTPQTIPGV